jgi:hypothetical protein
MKPKMPAGGAFMSASQSFSPQTFEKYQVERMAGDSLAEPLAVTQIQAARLLGVSDRTIRRWESLGLLKGNSVGGVRLYAIEKLKELIAGSTG